MNNYKTSIKEQKYVNLKLVSKYKTNKFQKKYMLKEYKKQKKNFLKLNKTLNN